MRRQQSLAILMGIGLLASCLVGCGPAEEELAATARAEAWTALQEKHEQLLQKRQELEDLSAKLEAGAESLEVAEGQSAEELLTDLGSQAEVLADEVSTDADSFMNELVTYINEDPVYRGEEPTEQQLAAIRMKSGEDLEVALEYVEKGGDWKRAGDILGKALSIDPDNAELQEQLAWVEEMRFVDKDRFSQLKKGMTQEEVAAVLGPVNLRNVKEFPEDRQVGWFYRKDPEVDGGAAGVYFRKSGGAWKAVTLNYEAIEP